MKLLRCTAKMKMKAEFLDGRGPRFVVLDTPVVIGSTMEADLSTLPDSDTTIVFNRAR